MKSLYLAILALISSQALIFSACAPYQNEEKPEVSPSDEELTLSVSGMKCQLCETKIKGALQAKDGVTSVTVKMGESNNLHVTFKPKLISQEQIKETVRALGFKVS